METSNYQLDPNADRDFSGADFSGAMTKEIMDNVAALCEIIDLTKVEAGTSERSKAKKEFCNVCQKIRGKMMYNVEYIVLLPEQFAGMRMRENYTIGVDGDPCAHEARTYTTFNRGTIYFNRLLEKLNVPKNKVGELVKKRVMFYVTTDEIPSDDGGTFEINKPERNKYLPGELIPGQPTPAGRGEGRSSGGNSRLAQPQAAAQAAHGATVTCPNCQQAVDPDKIDEHLITCEA